MEINQKEQEKRYYIKPTLDVKGDVIKREYFMDFGELNGVKDVYFNIAYRESIVVSRNGKTGLPNNQTIVKQQIKVDEVIDSETFVQNFNRMEALDFNSNSRKNLIGVASDWLLDSLTTEMGEDIGMTNAKIMLDSVVSEREKYILGLLTDLISAIQNSAFPFMTKVRKDKLVEILNVAY